MRNLLLLLLLAASSKAQITTVQEDSLITLGKEVLFAKTESARLKSNSEFRNMLFRLLHQPGSFENGFDSVKTMASKYAPDKKFRILNWNTRLDDGTYIYSAFIQTPEKITELKDKTPEIKSPETALLDKDKWFGALYYEIIKSGRRKDKYYMLLGWKGNDRLTTKKVIDVLSFNKNGEPVFGSKIFIYKPNEKANGAIFNRNKTRMIFEYSAEVSMSLKYDKVEEQIIFDHLSPRSSDLKGQFQYYGPDLSYDRIRRKKSKWIFEEDIDVRNFKNRTDELYKKP